MKILEKDITAKATELFLKYGIRSISMDDISREIGISKKTLYNHIIDKEELVRSACDNVIRSFAFKLNEINISNTDTFTKYSNLIMETLDLFTNKSFIVEYDLKKFYPEIGEDVSKRFNKLLQDSFQKIIEKGIREGNFRKDLDAKVISEQQIIQLQHLAEKKDEKNFKIEYHQVLTYHARAICTDNGLEKLTSKILKNI